MKHLYSDSVKLTTASMSINLYTMVLAKIETRNTFVQDICLNTTSTFCTMKMIKQ